MTDALQRTSSGCSVTLDGVFKTFSAPGRRTVEALRDVTLKAEPGEFVCVLGSTGCGKTTMLRVMAGLETVDKGTATVNGRRPVEVFDHIGFVFQQSALFPWRTVLENVTFGLETRGWNIAAARERARECLSMVGLAGTEKAMPYELSGGMQQRTALARALAPSPSLLLMDEPFGALDERTRATLQLQLELLWRSTGVTIVFVTHNIEEAVTLADRVVIMASEPGRIIAEQRVAHARPRDRQSDPFISDMLTVRRLFNEAVISAPLEL